LGAVAVWRPCLEEIFRLMDVGIFRVWFGPHRLNGPIMHRRAT
jgi:hypothetical protein